MRKRVLFGLLFSLSACSGGSGLAPTKSIGTAGGTITVDAKGNSAFSGTRLVVPPGALSGATDVVVEGGAELATGSVVALGPSVRIDPIAATLAIPATRQAEGGA